MGLQLLNVLYFDGFVVGGQVQIIEEDLDGALLKSFKDILPWQLREMKKVEENAKLAIEQSASF